MTAVEDLLRRRIADEGPLSFRDVMQAALYHPTLGYYARRPRIGPHGDFITSPSTHPAFGALLARQARDTWHALGQPAPFRILEIGGGDGALKASLLPALAIDSVAYAIEDVGDPPGTSAPHLVIANEVLDAQPVHRVVVREGRLLEMRVTLEDDRLAWATADAPPPVEDYFARLGLLPPEGAVAEVNLELAEWVARLANRLERGLVLLLDYGYPAEALFARPHGTLLTYWRHTLGSDPLVRLGDQDISAHVDFTTMATAAAGAGLAVVGVTSQTRLLHNLGIADLYQQLTGTADRRALASLVDPKGLGRIGAFFAARRMPDYVPTGLVDGHTWTTPLVVQALGDDADDDFLSQWREAFGQSK